MALALNNLKRVDMPLNKEIKPSHIMQPRNLDSQKICNATRFTVKSVMVHALKATIMLEEMLRDNSFNPVLPFVFTKDPAYHLKCVQYFFTKLLFPAFISIIRSPLAFLTLWQDYQKSQKEIVQISWNDCLFLSYLPNPSTRAGYDTRSIFLSGV